MPVLVNPSAYRHWVDLDDPVPDGSQETFTPSRMKCAIRPVAPGAFDEQKTTYIVEMRYHPQVTFNTRIRFTDKRGDVHHIYVRGIDNIDLLDRKLVLLCEEVVTP